MSLADDSNSFWAGYQVAQFGPEITAEESLAQIEARNALYPGITDLMPTSEQGVVLDFGCGPGIDTIQFLLGGAEHVVAADVSPRALEMLGYRLEAHELTDYCSLELADVDWTPPSGLDYIHCAGVLHHLADPVETLRKLAAGFAGRMRIMVYNAESAFYLACDGNLDLFRAKVDAGAPIANAWTSEAVAEMAAEAGLDCEYLGSYRHPAETSGPGLSSCYELCPASR